MNIAAVILVVAAGTTASLPVTLIDDGHPRCSIVTPDKPTLAVRRASTELAGYLNHISGGKVPLVGESQFSTGIRIDVGLTGRASALLPEGFLEDEERVFVHTDGDGVVICGCSDRATLFAVYRFLESLGCRWFAPEPENEIVPH